MQVDPTWDAVVRVASNKLKLKKKSQLRLFLFAPGKVARVELELLPDNISEMLRNGALVCVSPGGADCIARGGASTVQIRETDTGKAIDSLPPLPHYPGIVVDPGASPSNDERLSEAMAEGLDRTESTRLAENVGTTRAAAREAIDDCDGCTQAATKMLLAKLAAPVKAKPVALREGSTEFSSSGGFVKFEPHANYLPLLREAIAGETCFVERNVSTSTGSYISFDYSGEIGKAFPDPDQHPKKSKERWLSACR